jgi:MOSC domain-containing protein YiiM
MTILHPIKTRGRVEAILVNPRKVGDELETERVERVDARFEGFVGEVRHAGMTSLSDVRYRKQYADKTPIRNTRQLSILSAEDMAAVAEALGIGEVRPEWLGANLLVSGIPEFTKIPPSTRLIFSSGASLVVDNENAPCRYPAAVVDRHHPGTGAHFVKAATHKRGVVAWVEREGAIATGDEIAIHVPPRHIWDHE